MKTTEQSLSLTNLQIHGNYLEKKLSLFKDFLLVTISLKNSLHGQDDKAHIEKLLAQRQECIETLDKVDALIAKIAESNLSDKLNSEDPRKERLGFISEKLNRVIRKSVELDKECMALASSQLIDLKNEILKLRQGSGALNRYAGNAGRLPRFLDIKE
ncbi:MAG: hypothetical protein HY730_02880 [Candidatus Tectomicrobia bacterium]|uniref:Flagellar protein FlgN n=1 Tax=Tectimicrobiota bacterium TaxID=2528274 RepID=A0A933GKL6_UNCTE|nr:hypothetical protein [Candidatus Tectomicrobia bacterium]